MELIDVLSCLDDDALILAAAEGSALAADVFRTRHHNRLWKHYNQIEHERDADGAAVSDATLAYALRNAARRTPGESVDSWLASCCALVAAANGAIQQELPLSTARMIMTYVCVVMTPMGITPAGMAPSSPFGAAIDIEERRAALQRLVTELGGLAVDGTADHELLAAFSDPATAAIAAVRARRVVRGPAAAGTVVLEAQLAVHAGLGSPALGADALAAHQTRRVAAAANRGQIVLTRDAAQFVGRMSDVELEFAGRFPVRDFERPVELYVLHDGIESTAVGPLRIPTATRHKLVAPRTTFVGRVEELDDLALRLGSAKLVTVTGVGGIGKTRLVSELCRRHGASWFDGLCWVSLSQVSDPNLIEQSVLESIEPLAREAAPFVQSDEDASRFGRVLLDDVLNLIADKELLLVLDNCEHHRARIAALIDALLRHCPAVQVVATSREPLGLLDESVLRLRPLELGDAARLFLLRSGAVTADRAPNAELLELCNQLDCLPLAIELVAAHASNLPPQEITAMLRRFWFPSSADPSLDARQRTLSGMIGWSYALLSPAEQLALRRLTVLAAEFTLDTATATIRTDDGNIDAEEIVWALTRKSLLEPTPSQGTQRFRLLSTVRSVARSITPNPELLDAAMAAAQHLLACVGPDVHAVDHAVIERRQCELPNLRHLIDLLGCSDPAVADDLAWTIATQQRMTSAVAAATELYGYLTRHPRAGSRRIGLLVEAGRCAMEGGAVETAERFVDDARTLTEAFETPLCFDMELETLTAELYIVRGAPNLARQRAHSLLARARTTSGRARLLQLAGTAACEAGDLREGRRLLAQALDLQQGIGDLPAITALHALLARAALGDGDLAVAVSHERAALAGAVGARDIGSMASAAAFAAQLASERGQHATAAALIGGADRVLSTVGRQLVPGEADRRSQLLRRLRTALGCGFAEALQAGSELDLEGLVVATHSVIERSG